MSVRACLQFFSAGTEFAAATIRCQTVIAAWPYSHASVSGLLSGDFRGAKLVSLIPRECRVTYFWRRFTSVCGTRSELRSRRVVSAAAATAMHTAVPKKAIRRCR